MVGQVRLRTCMAGYRNGTVRYGTGLDGRRHKKGRQNGEPGSLDLDTAFLARGVAGKSGGYQLRGENPGVEASGPNCISGGQKKRNEKRGNQRGTSAFHFLLISSGSLSIFSFPVSSYGQNPFFYWISSSGWAKNLRKRIKGGTGGSRGRC